MYPADANAIAYATITVSVAAVAIAVINKWKPAKKEDTSKKVDEIVRLCRHLKTRADSAHDSLSTQKAALDMLERGLDSFLNLKRRGK